MNRPADMSAPIAALVDAHVHLYAMYDRERFFTAARANFDRARRRLGLPHAQYVMCFTEDSRHDAFGELPGRFGSVEILATPEESALRVRFAGEQDGPEMYVLAGRQIITSEGLELLALATRIVIPDGVSLAEGIERVRAANGTPVVPWAFGKWWGRRGQVVRAALTSADPPDLGDNSARPSISPDPDLFARAESIGRKVLPGTDPLPLRAHQTRAGSYGFVLEGGVSVEQPARSLVSALAGHSRSPKRFGARVGPVAFVRDQVALRLTKGSRARAVSQEADHGQLEPRSEPRP